MYFTSRFSAGLRASIFVAGALMLGAPHAHANYRTKAIELTNAIQREFYVPNEGIYHGDFPVNPKGLTYEVMWGNGVQFSVLAAATKYEPDLYKPTLYAFTKGLERYWDKDAPVPGFDAYFSSKDGDDKYYDDNAWLVLGFCEAYRVTKDRQFADWARKTQNFVLSGWDEKLGGGIYWYQNRKESKNTCINAPGAVGALALYAIDGQKSDLEWAQKIYDWTRPHLQDPADGLYWDNINLTGKIEQTKWTYNSALMIRANLDLWKVTKKASYLQEARRESDAALQRWADPKTGAFADSARFNHLLAEALLQSYEATNDVKYLNAVRRHADFGNRYVRDVRTGDYFNKWGAENRADDERKTLIENASAARLLWLLVPYMDVDELEAKGDEALQKGESRAAVGWYKQAFDSTAGATPTKPAAPVAVASVGF
ncbi:cellobiose 2-epimerase [Abditibacteriota bacterium]|nr:cellobiose 2-epimerase [Abditibacteriota bacterium]